MDSANTSISAESDKDSLIAELTRSNRVLKANISTLYRTARAELCKKDQQISTLRNELDDLIFKRLGQDSVQDQNMPPESGASSSTA